jgi:hypothetical protein
MTKTQTENRSETIRWLILLTISNACPAGTNENALLLVIKSQHPDADRAEMRSNLDYLVQNQLILLDASSTGPWFCMMRNEGMRFVYYATDVLPGIARPVKPQAQDMNEIRERQ